VDAVGAFSDTEAMQIMKEEFIDLQPRMKVTKKTWIEQFKRRKGAAATNLEKLVASDPILSLFEFYNDNKAVASASIGQVYKAKIRKGPQLEAAIGKENAAKWGGRTVAIKVQRPDVAASASLDMYLLRRTAMWLSKMRGGGLPAIADQ
jgi:predicted unusual protein kinase regulating ubiquinone biosynthesis (AarF/ABC1/UbiB family)